MQVGCGERGGTGAAHAKTRFQRECIGQVSKAVLFRAHLFQSSLHVILYAVLYSKTHIYHIMNCPVYSKAITF